MPKSKDSNEVICTDNALESIFSNCGIDQPSPFCYLYADVSGSPRTLGLGSETAAKLL